MCLQSMLPQGSCMAFWCHVPVCMPSCLRRVTSLRMDCCSRHVVGHALSIKLPVAYVYMCFNHTCVSCLPGGTHMLCVWPELSGHCAYYAPVLCTYTKGLNADCVLGGHISLESFTSMACCHQLVSDSLTCCFLSSSFKVNGFCRGPGANDPSGGSTSQAAATQNQSSTANSKSPNEGASLSPSRRDLSRTTDSYSDLNSASGFSLQKQSQ